MVFCHYWKTKWGTLWASGGWFSGEKWSGIEIKIGARDEDSEGNEEWYILHVFIARLGISIRFEVSP